MHKLNIQKIREYFMESFVYDFITDNDIEKALKSEIIDKIDSKIEWQDDTFLKNTKLIPDEKKHSYRVASIVLSIKEFGLKEPLSFDTMGRHYVCALPDGHHRIRALQYLGNKCVPAELSGFIDENEKLVKYCNCN